MRSPNLDASLKNDFGFAAFRPGQRELIDAVLGGRDALGVLPTGGGKSLTYQLPALLLQGLTLVVSPLIALMKDQVDAFNRRGRRRAVALHSNLTAAEARVALAQLHSGDAALLYVAPERLEIPGFRDRVAELKPGLLVIDEAHCVNQWGFDFRPSYLSLKDLVRQLRPAPVLALTATANPSTRNEILERLGLREPVVYVASFDRPNLRFEVHPCPPSVKFVRLRHLLRNAAGAGSHIVYVGRRRDAEAVAAQLTAGGLAAVPYHAGLSPRERVTAQESWLSGSTPIAVATVAFGMGIDKPDVRTVIHYQHPAALEAYYQEAGRAGRDQAPARCILLYSKKDVALAHFFIRNRYPSRPQVLELLAGISPEGTGGDVIRSLADDLSDEQVNAALQALSEQGHVWRDSEGNYHREPGDPHAARISLDALFLRKRADYRRLEEVVAYCNEQVCNRAALLRYFGEEIPQDHRCGNCSACLGTARRSALEAAHEEARRLYRLHAGELESRGPLSPVLLARFLGRTQSKRFPPEWRDLRGYGALKDLPAATLRTLAAQVLEAEAGRSRASGQLRIPVVGSAKAGTGSVFWRSGRRSYTAAELKARKVSRRAGLLILGLVRGSKQGLAPSMIAGILRGKRGAAAPARFVGALEDRSYRDLMADVLAMWAKGYLQERAGRGRKLELAPAGSQALEAAAQASP